MALPCPLIMGWRVRSLVQDPWGACVAYQYKSNNNNKSSNTDTNISKTLLIKTSASRISIDKIIL